MKKILALMLILLGLAALCHGAAGEEDRRLTLMVYLCGSNLESGYGSATADLEEMLASGCDWDAVTVLLMAGGTARWNSGFDPACLSIAELGKRGMRVVWREDARSMGEAETLTALLDFGMERYPARDYALILWNHGGGPLEGVCWDELFSMDSLDLGELTEGLSAAACPRKLSWIGFDACLMGCAEVASALSPYAEYMIASQEREPASGWDYSFLSGLASDADGAAAGRRAVDAYFDSLGDTRESVTLSCIDLSRIPAVVGAMDAFFTEAEETLDAESFSRLSGLRLASAGFGKAASGSGGNGYDLVDLYDLVSRSSRDGSGDALLSALSEAVAYSRSTVPGASGLSVYHPFANKESYLEKWGSAYEELDFSDGYLRYVGAFGALLTGEAMADWSGLEARETEYGPEENNVFSLALTPEQKETFAEAQLLVLAAEDLDNGAYGTFATAAENAGKGRTYYSPVFSVQAELNADGTLTAAYTGRTLYATDARGVPLLGPLSWRLAEDGETLQVKASYSDRSGREDAKPSLSVIFCAREEGADGYLGMTSVLGYDGATDTYTTRVPVDESEYTALSFYPDLRALPGADGILPGFDEWESLGRYTGDEIRLPETWRLRFFDRQLSAAQLYAVFQVTDTQQDSFCTPPVPVTNPNLEQVGVYPRSLREDAFDMTLWATRNTSPLDPGLDVTVEMTNRTEWTSRYMFEEVVLNGSRCALDPNGAYLPMDMANVAPGETKVDTIHISSTRLTGLKEVSGLSFTLRVAMEDHVQGNYEETLDFSLDRCDLSGVAREMPEILAETESDGITWQLLSLDRNQQGNMTGVLRVLNGTQAAIDGDIGSVLVNGVSTGGSMILSCPPGTDVCLPFEAQDSIRLMKDFHIDGRQRLYSLASSGVLGQYGAGEVKSLQLLFSYGYSISRSVELVLKEPWRFSGEETAPPEGRPVLEGVVSAQVERVLLADDGVGLRLAFHNDTDRNVLILMKGWCVNGRPADNRYPEVVLIAAHGTTVVCTGIEAKEALETGERISEVGLCFEPCAAMKPVFTTGTARIDVSLPESGERYLPWDCWETEPVSYGPAGDAPVRPDRLKAGGFLVRPSFEMEGSGAGAHPAAVLRIENRGERAASYALRGLTVNGVRAVSGEWTTGELQPGETGTLRAGLAMEALKGLSGIRGCTGTVTDGEETLEMDLAVEDFEFAERLPEAMLPLAEGSMGDVLWRLMAAEPGEDTLELLLWAENRGASDFSETVMLVADGLTLRGSLDGATVSRSPEFTLPARRSAFFRFSAEDALLVPTHQVEVYKYGSLKYPLAEGLLARHGIGRLTRLALLSNVNAYSWTVGVECVLTPAEPVPLSRSAREAAVQLPDAGPCGLGLQGVLIGYDGIALALDVTNREDRPVRFMPGDFSVNGQAVTLEGYNTYTLPPNSTTCLCLAMKVSGFMRPGDEIDTLDMGFLISSGNVSPSDGRERITLTFPEGARLGIENGILYN